MKNIIAIILLILSMLFRYQKGQNVYNKVLPTHEVELETNGFSDDVITPVITDIDIVTNAAINIHGTYVVKKLYCVDRVTNEEYVLNNNDVVGKTLIIDNNGVIYDEIDYKWHSTSERNAYEISNLYILPFGTANLICGIDASASIREAKSVYIRLFGLSSEEPRKGIGLFVKPDGVLLLNLFEGHEYWGFFELSKIGYTK